MGLRLNVKYYALAVIMTTNNYEEYARAYKVLISNDYSYGVNYESALSLKTKPPAIEDEELYIHPADY